MAHRVLMVSPIPSHPTDQGNSARIHALGQLLQSAGFLVHFLYCPYEGLTPQQRCKMENCWDCFHTAPAHRHAVKPVDGYKLDDWYAPAVSEVARDLQRRWHFCAVLANYVWFSKVLDAFEADVVKVLDTHDVFGRRQERFISAGLQPEWFYTSDAEEARGLARADIVLAIQPEERLWFQTLGHPDVRTVGHLTGRRRRAPRPAPDGRVVVGYLASGNPLNIASFKRMMAALPRGCDTKMRFLIAGSICDRFATGLGPFEPLGRVARVDDFYDRVDLVVNPMLPGTGLKIKSVEAVLQGVPLIATRSATVGLPVSHPLHFLDTPEVVASALMQLSIDRAFLEHLAAASEECAAIYADAVTAAVDDLADSLRRRSPRQEGVLR